MARDAEARRLLRARLDAVRGDKPPSREALKRFHMLLAEYNRHLDAWLALHSDDAVHPRGPLPADAVADLVALMGWDTRARLVLGMASLGEYRRAAA